MKPSPAFRKGEPLGDHGGRHRGPVPPTRQTDLHGRRPRSDSRAHPACSAWACRPLAHGQQKRLRMGRAGPVSPAGPALSHTLRVPSRSLPSQPGVAGVGPLGCAVLGGGAPTPGRCMRAHRGGGVSGAVSHTLRREKGWSRGQGEASRGHSGPRTGHVERAPSACPGLGPSGQQRPHGGL